MKLLVTRSLYLYTVGINMDKVLTITLTGSIDEPEGKVAMLVDEELVECDILFECGHIITTYIGMIDLQRLGFGIGDLPSYIQH